MHSWNKSLLTRMDTEIYEWVRIFQRIPESEAAEYNYDKESSIAYDREFSRFIIIESTTNRIVPLTSIPLWPRIQAIKHILELYDMVKDNIQSFNKELESILNDLEQRRSEI